MTPMTNDKEGLAMAHTQPPAPEVEAHKLEPVEAGKVVETIADWLSEQVYGSVESTPAEYRSELLDRAQTLIPRLTAGMPAPSGEK